MSTDPYTGNRYAFGGGPLSNIDFDGHLSVGGLLDDAGTAVEGAKAVAIGVEDGAEGGCRGGRVAGVERFSNP